MFLSGLDNIDFTGIGGLSGEMSRGTLFSMFRSALAPGFAFSVSDAEINAILDQVFSGYKISNEFSPDQAIINTVQSGIKAIVIGVLGVAKAGAYSGEIQGVIDNLSNQNYVAVPRNYTAPAAPPTTPVSSKPVYGPQPAPPQYGPPEQSSPGPATTSQQGGGSPVLPTQPIQRSPLPVRRITRAHVQTPAEKKRLLLIIGGFGLLFVVALGVIASRD